MADFAALTVVDLKEECRSRSLPLGGVKKELIKRLKAFETKASRAKAKEQEKVAASKAARAAQVDLAPSVTDATAQLAVAAVKAADQLPESQVLAEGSLLKAEGQVETQHQLLEPQVPIPQAPVAPEAVAPEAVAPGLSDEAASDAAMPTAAAPEAAAPEALAHQAESLAAEARETLAPEVAVREATVPQAAPDSPDAASRSGSRSRSPLAQGFGYQALVKRSVSRSRSPLVRKEQATARGKLVLKKRLSILEREAAHRSPSTDASESSQHSSSSSKSSRSRESMRSCSPSVCSPPSKTRRVVMQSPAPSRQQGPRNSLFGSAIKAITPAKNGPMSATPRNGPASATPRKQMTPSFDPGSVERARTRADELRQRLMMSFSPAPVLKVQTPGTEDSKMRYHDLLGSAPTPTRSQAAHSSGLTPQQDSLLHNFMNASCTPKASPCASPAADLVPQSPGGSVHPRNLTWALSDAVADEVSGAKRQEAADGKARMLEALTKQLQVCLARLQDQRLDDASREKYQTLAASVKSQMDKVTELAKPSKGMKMQAMGSRAAHSGGC